MTTLVQIKLLHTVVWFFFAAASSQFPSFHGSPRLLSKASREEGAWPLHFANRLGTRAASPPR
jgi:hypothetical protein